MSDRVLEEAGAAAPGKVLLTGALDGVNRLFRTTRPMGPAPVMVYRNGLCKAADLDDGYVVLDATGVLFKEAPQAVDTVAISYVPITGPTLPVGIPSGGSATLARPGAATGTMAQTTIIPYGGTIKYARPTRNVWDRDCPKDDDMSVATFPNGGIALPPGVPVDVDPTGRLKPADALDGAACRVVGITQVGAQPWAQYVRVVSDGLCLGVLFNIAAKTQFYVGEGGGLSQQPPLTRGAVVYYVGFAANSTDLLVQLRQVTLRT